MIKFSKENVLSIYEVLTLKTGGTVGIRDEGLLASALEAPYQTFSGVDLFPTLLEKGVRLGFGLVSNHPFVDGNKRIGILIMLVFFEMNGILIDFTDDEVVDMALGLASGKYSYNDLLSIVSAKL
jgi:death-on-curing protein